MNKPINDAGKYIFTATARIMNYIRKHFYTDELQPEIQRWPVKRVNTIRYGSSISFQVLHKNPNKHLSQNFIKTAIGFDCQVHLFDFEIQLKSDNRIVLNMSGKEPSRLLLKMESLWWDVILFYLIEIHSRPFLWIKCNGCPHSPVKISNKIKWRRSFTAIHAEWINISTSKYISNWHGVVSGPRRSSHKI